MSLLQADQSSEAAACVLISQLLSKEGGVRGESESQIPITSYGCRSNTVDVFPEIL